MKSKFILIASALLLVSNIAGAQEQKTPSASTQEQQAPTAKMTGEDMRGHTGQRMMGRSMMRKGMMHGMHMRLILILMDADATELYRSRNSKRAMREFSRESMRTRTAR